MVITGLLVAFLVVSVYTDIAYRKVYNAVTLPVMALGLALNFWYYGFAGLEGSLLGILAGFLFLFLFYMLGGIGAGDVKFLMAAGSLTGFEFTAMGTLYGAVIGGAAAVFVMVHQGRLASTLKEIGARFLLFVTLRSSDSLVFDDKKTTKLPYAVFLAAGMLIRLVETGKPQ